MLEKKKCSVDKCANQSYTKELCKKHYQRNWLRGNTALHPKFGQGETFAERFWSKVAITADDQRCWEWQASLTNKGYGKTFYENKGALAHRIAWLLTKQELLPSAIFLLHSCDNPPCVNPAHLRKGDQKDNMRDLVERDRSAKHWSKRTHCKYGHEYTAENTKIEIRKDGTVRICKTCLRSHWKKMSLRRRESC